MTTAPDRDAIRDEIADLCETAGDWQAVYTCQPKTFGGQSPVMTLHDGPMGWEFLAAGYAPDVFNVEIWVTNYVRRGPDDDEDVAETTLDTLLAALLELIDDNRVGTAYTQLRIEPPTEPDYIIVDGIQYRTERVRLVCVVRN